MKGFYDREKKCADAFGKLGACWHLSTCENFEIIMTSDDDYRIGMGIVGICARLFPDVRILTFELMSNHLHLTAGAEKERLVHFFETMRKMLSKYVRSRGRTLDMGKMTYMMNPVETLEQARNTIVYDNRNGYVVSHSHTPFSYPWGANRYYFNPDAKRFAEQNARKMVFSEIRSISHTHKSDGIPRLLCLDGCALPTDFCDITLGENLFRDASHYFYMVSKNIEANRHIAKEIGESVFYTDNELFAAITRICREKYATQNMSEASPEAKLDMARIMRFEYNASSKQIMRFLRLSDGMLASIGIG